MLKLLAGLLIGFVVGMMNQGLVDGYDYQRDMVVVEAEGSNLVLQDINGEVWEVMADGYQLADTVVVSLSDNDTTHTVYDDVIVNVEPLVVGSY
jgi:hypothetical protein